jgi:hypothetical protein
MRPWNPHGQTFHGEPITGQIPVRVVVRGPEMTPQQSAFLQAAYASFAAGARISIAPNPSAQGYLPDGSQYTIDCVNGVCTCVVWTVGGGEDMRRSGIGISLTTLGGGLVPGHIHKDGDRPQPYILTPGVIRGTRKCSGSWRVRKVDGYSGGKAVWTDAAGKKSIVGVDGVIYDRDLIGYQALHRLFGTNNRAYWAGEYIGGTRIFRDGEKEIGAFHDRIDTLPFLRKRANGETWLMQITPVFSTEVRLRLYGEKFDGAESTTPLVDMLDEIGLPPGYSMIWQTLSVAPDGLEARINLRRASDSIFAEADIAISENSLTFTSVRSVGSSTPGGSQTSTTGSQSENGVFTRITIDTPGWNRLTGGYGYDARGGKASFSLVEANPSKRIDARTEVIETRNATGKVVEGWFIVEGGYRQELFSSSTHRMENFPHTAVTYAGRTWRFDAGSEEIHANTSINRQLRVDPRFPGTITEHTVSSANERKVRHDNATTVLFVDTLLDFHIVSQHIHKHTGTTAFGSTYDFPPGGTEGTVTHSTSEVEKKYSRKLIAVHKGQEILLVETPLPDGEGLYRVQYVASSAMDPLTGAACVNVLEVDTLAGFSAPPLRSWIIVVDDVKARLLHDIMDLPNTTDIRIKKDYALLSVV